MDQEERERRRLFSNNPQYQGIDEGDLIAYEGNRVGIFYNHERIFRLFEVGSYGSINVLVAWPMPYYGAAKAVFIYQGVICLIYTHYDFRSTIIHLLSYDETNHQLVTIKTF